MEFVSNGSEIYLYLKRGDKVMENLTEVAKENNLKSATFSGIGAVTNVTLGYYNLSEKTYEKRNFDDTYELVSCLGNITHKDGDPFVHAHVTIGDRNYRLFGGHLFEATVAVVGEFSIVPFDKEITRSHSEEIGLAVWDLEKYQITSKK